VSASHLTRFLLFWRGAGAGAGRRGVVCGLHRHAPLFWNQEPSGRGHQPAGHGQGAFGAVVVFRIFFFFLLPTDRLISCGGGDEQEMYVVPITSDDVHFRDMLRLEQDKLLMVVVTDKDFVQRP